MFLINTKQNKLEELVSLYISLFFCTSDQFSYPISTSIFQQSLVLYDDTKTDIVTGVSF